MKIGEKNIGRIDQASRAILGIIFLFMYAGNHVIQPWPYVVLALGLVMVATAAFGTCPLYTLVGISTCAVKGKKK